MPATKTSVFRFSDVEVREREFSLTKAGEVLPVEPKAFRVLLALLRNPGKLIGKEELLNAVWGDAATGQKKWAFSGEGSWVVSSPAVKEGRVYFVTSDSSLLYALDAKSGAVLQSVGFNH